jgi:hypothetical protein
MEDIALGIKGIRKIHVHALLGFEKPLKCQAKIKSNLT